MISILSKCSHFTEDFLDKDTGYFQFKNLLKMKVWLRAFYGRKLDTEIGLEIQSYDLKHLTRTSSSSVKKEMSKIEFPQIKRKRKSFSKNHK